MDDGMSLTLQIFQRTLAETHMRDAYDESSGTALWTCPTNLKADYTVTFCP